MSINRIRTAPQWGKLNTYEEIEVGRELGPIEWVCNSETLDLLLQCYDLWHEWYVIDSPFGGRLVPPPAVVQLFIALNPYTVRTAPTLYEEEMIDVLRLDQTLIFRGRIADKYIREDREWVLFEASCTDQEGRVLLRRKSLSALSFVTMQERERLDQAAASDHTKKEIREVYPYVPPVLEPKKPEEWKRDPTVPISNVSDANKDMPLGTELVPMSTQYTWRRMRDWEQYTYHEFMQWPLSAAIYNIHTHPDSARAFGLLEPNIGVPRYVAFLSLMMLNTFGQGWLRGGKFSYRFVRWVGLFDFITAKARLVRKELEGASVRLTFDTWIENQRGEKILTGTSSGIVPL